MMHVPPWPIILLKILLVSLCFKNEASAPASALRARAIPWSSEIFSVITWSTDQISTQKTQQIAARVLVCAASDI